MPLSKNYFFITLALCTLFVHTQGSENDIHAIKVGKIGPDKPKKIFGGDIIDFKIDYLNLKQVDEAIDCIQNYINFLKQHKPAVKYSAEIIQWLQTKTPLKYNIHRNFVLHNDSILLARLIKKFFNEKNAHQIRYMLNAIRLDELAEKALIDSNLAALIDVSSGTVSVGPFDDAIVCRYRWEEPDFINKLKENHDDDLSYLKTLRRVDSFLKKDPIVPNPFLRNKDTDQNTWLSGVISKIKGYFR
jgi:hypothetical protein